jgi:hypothetical protein
MAKEYLFPTALDLDNANFVLTGAATKWEALDDPINAPNDADYIACATDGQTIRFTMSNTSAAISSVTPINFIKVWHRAGAAGLTFSGQLTRGGYRSNAVSTFGPWVQSLGYAIQGDQFGLDNDGLPWTKTNLDALVGMLGFQDLSSPVDGARFSQLLIEIDFVASPAKLEAARRRASFRLLTRRAALQTFRGRF